MAIEIKNNDDRIAALSMVSTALYVLQEYKCKELCDLISEKGFEPVKKEIDQLLSEQLVKSVL